MSFKQEHIYVPIHVLLPLAYHLCVYLCVLNENASFVARIVTKFEVAVVIRIYCSGASVLPLPLTCGLFVAQFLASVIHSLSYATSRGRIKAMC